MVSTLKIRENCSLQKVFRFANTTYIVFFNHVNSVVVRAVSGANRHGSGTSSTGKAPSGLPRAVGKSLSGLGSAPCVQLSDPNKFCPNVKAKGFFKVPRKVLGS